MIAAEPNPLAILLQDLESLKVVGANALRRACIVKTIAERSMASASLIKVSRVS
jgi:hypothetical protein